ncbi:MAG: hypothetical protein MZV70_53325 [Desulfobacterales bacterium]|nr:hypothetical protein [Desulfobacterales bacterium]
MFYILMIFKWITDCRDTFPGYFSIYIIWFRQRRRTSGSYRRDQYWQLPCSSLPHSVSLPTPIISASGTNCTAASEPLSLLMIWLYLNSLALLVGFELNVSIKAATAELKEKT